ncbi:type II toxin-antitoxin system Phd/YefM family antitoxin [Pseudarthrobacter sp. NIBRBAC000502770]|uniref:type II toxin-antitoxin system Phd/YefM family antitoxin n=1 Tax=Pseudarthrobacter sp. NIBRBAC000502770 TaxID=2590785 RepID=UPI003529DD8B
MGSNNQEVVMAITATEARRDLARLTERVNVDRTEVVILSKRGSAVLLSKDAYDALVETSYLLSSPANAPHYVRSGIDPPGRNRQAQALEPNRTLRGSG